MSRTNDLRNALHNRKAFQKYAQRSDFVEWVHIANPMKQIRRIAIVQPQPGAGLQWVDLGVDQYGRVMELRRSGGAFYDAEDHPEGALAWARTNVRQKLLTEGRRSR